MLVAIMGTPHRFPTRQAFWSYCGFAVVMHATGQYSVAHSGKIIPNKKANKTRGLNRNRNPHLKKVFKGAAIVAVRQPEFAAYLDRLMEGGLSRDVAMVTVARKLATIVLTIWKKEVSYDPKRLLEQEA
jgi:transposase